MVCEGSSFSEALVEGAYYYERRKLFLESSISSCPRNNTNSIPDGNITISIHDENMTIFDPRREHEFGGLFRRETGQTAVRAPGFAETPAAPPESLPAELFTDVAQSRLKLSSLTIGRLAQIVLRPVTGREWRRMRCAGLESEQGGIMRD